MSKGLYGEDKIYIKKGVYMLKGSILIAIINYANESEVLNYAKMIAKQTVANSITLLVINNKEDSNSKINLTNEFQKINLSIIIYNPHDNLGYLNGCLYGYRKYTEEFEQIPDWFVMSNTDIEISDITFFERLLSNGYEENVWCVAPSIYSPNNKSFDNPHYINRCSLKKLNRIIRVHEYPLLAYGYSELSKIKAKLKRTVKKPSQYVYSVHGCFFALRSNFIEEIKDKFYEGFMYSEEAYIAEYLLLFNKKAFYDATLEITHYENSVTGLLGIKRKSKYIANSLKYIRNEFYLK